MRRSSLIEWALPGIASTIICLTPAWGAVVQSNTTYVSGTSTLPVSSTDLINIGQSTLGGFTVSANSSPDETPDQGAIDGTAIGGFESFTWFSAAGTPDTSLAVNPGVFTFNLDVSVNTLGYDIAQIDSFAGYNFRAQADQIVTVEYSLVGDAGFNTLGTYSYLDPGGKEFSRISLTDDTADHMLTGVDALRFTYADPGNKYHEIVIQEIDVVGAASTGDPATDVVQSNTTYTDITGLTVSNTDLVNLGQATLASFDVTANHGADQTPDNGPVDGAASVTDWESFTWFLDSKGQFPATVTLNLDVTANTAGYHISEITSFAGFSSGVQGKQVVTVEYSLVGETGFATLGTYVFETPGEAEFGSMKLSKNGGGDLLSGVDSLRLTYALPTGTDRMVLQEIDVVGAAVVDLVQSNSTYTDIAELTASNTDLVNLGQATLASFDVTVNQGADQTPDNGPVDGTVSVTDWESFTWFLNSKGQFPATVTLNLDVVASPSGYTISEINSLAGFSGSAAQGKQVVTVEYSLVGDSGFADLGTFTNLTAGIGEYSRIQIASSAGGDILAGVDALKLTYALPEGTDRMVLQEIDVIGAGEVAPEPPVTLGLASMFSHDMILQRDQLVPVWGTSDSGAAITVEFAGQSKTTTAAADGSWRVDLDPVAASFASRALTVSAQLGAQTAVVSFSNVLVGEVWLASGQSNMAWDLHKTDDGLNVVANATHPEIRLLKVPQVSSATPLSQIDAVWTECNPDTAHNSYGVAYYFARKLQEQLNVPVGVIQCAWPGSAIEKWQVGSGTYYNGMIAPQLPFAIRGAIWYQGESNVADGMLYVDKQKNMVEGWRAQWGYDFPFYYTQIAPFDWNNANDGLIPFFWEAQSACLDVVPNTGMAVITDTVADVGDLHPGNKEDPGNRLAFLALDNTYGQNIVSTGPVFQSVETVGNTLEITFGSAQGLTTRDGLAPDWFEIQTRRGSYTSADAVISGNKVILSAPGVNNPTSMRFGWNEIAQPNLVNGAGLVASAFRAEVVAGTSGGETSESSSSGAGEESGGAVGNTALSGTLVQGTAAGTLEDGDVNDDAHFAITEEVVSDTSVLEYVWTFDVPSASSVTFYVEAHHTANSEGDDFVFAYSLDDTNYTDMVTVVKTADDDTVQFHVLPETTSGTVYVRVRDVDFTPGNTVLDTIAVDAIFIVTE